MDLWRPRDAVAPPRGRPLFVGELDAVELREDAARVDDSGGGDAEELLVGLLDCRGDGYVLEVFDGYDDAALGIEKPDVRTGGIDPDAGISGAVRSLVGILDEDGTSRLYLLAERPSEPLFTEEGGFVGHIVGLSGYDAGDGCDPLPLDGDLGADALPALFRRLGASG
jgi:hypothetical protein